MTINSRNLLPFIYIKGDRSKLQFKQVEPYVIEMRGYKPGTVQIGTIVDHDNANHLPQLDGPYLYRGLNVNRLGCHGVISSFDINHAEGVVRIKLRQ